jgi:hypothetical protein
MAKSGINESLQLVSLKHIDYHGPIYKIGTQGNGSCFFHAVLRARHKPYIEAANRDQREKIAVDARRMLADQLEKVNPITGKRLYDTLGGGFYEDFSKAGDVAIQYSLPAMLKELRSNDPVDTAYQELCATVFEHDIYIISADNGDVYPTANEAILFQGRSSIFIYGMPGHYEILAIPMKQSGIYACLLTPDHPFTVAVNARVKALVKTTPPKVPPILTVAEKQTVLQINPPVSTVKSDSVSTSENSSITRITNAPGPVVTVTPPSLISSISNLNIGGDLTLSTLPPTPPIVILDTSPVKIRVPTISSDPDPTK